MNRYMCMDMSMSAYIRVHTYTYIYTYIYGPGLRSLGPPPTPHGTFRNSFCFAIMYRKSVKTITSKEYHNLIKAKK